LRAVRPRGRACQVGFLGGLAPTEFNSLVDLPTGVQLSFFASAFAFGTDADPFSAVPMQTILAKVERGTLKAKPKRVFRLDEIAEAHRVMDAGEAGGKLVVALD
jgi:NADPH2:quinone reductase